MVIHHISDLCVSISVFSDIFIIHCALWVNSIVILWKIGCQHAER